MPAMTFDLRLDMPLTDQEIKTYLQELNAIRKSIASVAAEPKNPADAARKIILYTDLQHVIGELYAQTVYDHSMAYIERKNAWAEARERAFGSEKDRDAIADKLTVKERTEEAKAKANMKRWEMQYNNAEQKANALKKQWEVIFNDFRATGRGGG